MRIDQYSPDPVSGAATEFVLNDTGDTTMGAFGTTKRAYADQVPALASGLTASSPLMILHTAIANRDNARVEIPVIGDSITEGQGATQFTNRWVASANRAMRAVYPTVANGAAGGLGFIPLANTGEDTYTWPVTAVSGSAASFLIGPVRDCQQVTGTASWTFTAPAGTTSVQVMYFDAGVSGSFTYKVGSGSATTVTNAGSGIDTFTSSIPLASGQVLTIAWASGDAFIDGIVHFAGDEASGITFHGCGHFGWDAGVSTDPGAWNQTLESGFNWNLGIAALDPAAIMIMLGTNDASTDGGDYSAADFQVNLGTLVTYLQSEGGSLASVPIVLVIPYQPDVVFADGSWPPYVAAIRGAAAAIPNAYVIDLNYRLPTVASDFDGDALYADTIHPTDLGHALIGEIVAGALQGLPPVPRSSPVFTGVNGLPQVTTPAGLTSYVQQAQAAATSPVTVASTAAIASLGSLTVPANDPVAGAKYKITAHGTLSIASAGTATTYVCDLRWGGTTGTLLVSLHSTSTANSPLLPNSSALSAVPVLIEGEIEFRTSTTVTGWLRMTWTNSTTAATAATVAVASITSPVTVTVSSPESLTLDWTWGTSSASNTITIASSTFERVS